MAIPYLLEKTTYLTMVMIGNLLISFILFAVTVMADAEKLLHAYRSAGDIRNSEMGRSASRKWAKKHQRRSNYEKENEKREGRRARLEETERARKQGQETRYSWQDQENGELHSSFI